MIWGTIARFIIRRRFYLLAALLLLVVFMGYHARDAKISHQFLQIMPENDSIFREHVTFRERFGEDGNLFVIGFEGDLFSNPEIYRHWYFFSRYAAQTEGVEEVLSLARLYTLERDDAERSLKMIRMPESVPATQQELNELKNELYGLPFYRGLLYSEDKNVHLLAIRFDKPTLYSAQRIDIIEDLQDRASLFGRNHNLEMRYSGLPFIRSVLVTQVGSELELFIVLAVIVTALILLIFFKSIYWVAFPLVVISVLIVFVLGTFGLFNYQITLLSALIPPLVIVICVPNFIYFLNKYHIEFRKHGNKMRAITRVIRKVGVIMFMTNFSTAIGFGVLALTQSPALQEFGIVAALNILATYFVSIILIPVTFSLLPEPSARQTNYLEGRWINGFVGMIRYTVLNHRKWVYTVSVLLLIIAVGGLLRLEAVGFIMDDIPKHDRAYRDLVFFEENFNGIMPLEVSINTGIEHGLRRHGTLVNIRNFQDTLESFPEISRSVSPADLLMFARQAYYNGNESRYGMPSRREESFLQPYITGMETRDKGILASLSSENEQFARISANIKDIGSVRLTELINQLNEIAEDFFPADEFEVAFTGTTIVFVKGNDYLVRNLLQSLTLAFFIIAILMGLLFQKFRMVLISLVPNFLPLIITAGVMGYAGITLKPSTLLVFSIAFGIAIDDALHFLGKYRQEFPNFNRNIADTITFSLRETGTSMIYTSLVLFCGFSIFYFSDFGGTQAIGLLTSMTLLVAMITNLFLLPSLLLTFDKDK